MMEIALTGKNGAGKFALIDDEDFDRVYEYDWWLHKTGYPCTNINGIQIKLHRFVMNAPKGSIVDHINMNRIDSRKENLRYATFEQNLSNSGARYGRKYKGVYHEKSGKPKCWHVIITVDNKHMSFGRYYTELEGAKVYDENIFKYRGEFARLNFPIENN